MPAEVQSFFQGFNFDTLLALISCLTGIVALFVGGAAYKQSQINKNSFNDKKEFKDESQDHSQKAGRDIVINQYDPSALAALSAANFESSLKLVYSQLEQKASDNLQTIINESKKIIEENKIQLQTKGVNLLVAFNAATTFFLSSSPKSSYICFGARTMACAKKAASTNA